jgi:hypothetical protein
MDQLQVVSLNNLIICTYHEWYNIDITHITLTYSPRQSEGNNLRIIFPTPSDVRRGTHGKRAFLYELCNMYLRCQGLPLGYVILGSNNSQKQFVPKVKFYGGRLYDKTSTTIQEDDEYNNDDINELSNELINELIDQ